MSANKIRASKIPEPTGIRTMELQSGSVRFSFKHLNFTDKFRVSHRNGQYIHKLLERLKNVSSMNAGQLRGNHARAVRSHPIIWSQTTEPKGFSHLNEQLRCIDAFQFECEEKQYGRIHGFYIDNIFFVVWLDPDHSLYP